MNEKWFALTLEEIEKKLKTNAASGLSRKAARSRIKTEPTRVFFMPSASPLSYLGDIIGDFAYIILMVMSFIALCFDEGRTGGVCAAVIVVNLIVAYFTYYRSQFLCNSLQRAFLPRCRVIREGKLFSVDGAHVVRGDVIMLETGDILSCDARLVSSNGLRVKMLVEKGKYVLLDKAAQARVAQNEIDVTKMDNIVHAGSVVLSGSARAIVTEVGGYTYVGARMGGVAVEPRGGGKIPVMLSLFKKYSSKLSIILLASLIPFSIACMFFGGDTLSLFTVFMTAIAISASFLPQFATTVGRIFFTLPMQRSARAYDKALVRSPYAMEGLASASYLFVLDGSALCDGVLHFDSVISAEGELSSTDINVNDQSLSLIKLGELAVLYDGAQRRSLSLSAENGEKYGVGICEFINRINADKEALKIRCSISGFAAASDGNAAYDKLFYSELGEKYMLCVSRSDSIINECSEVYVQGRRYPMDEQMRTSMMNRYTSYARRGAQVLVFCYCRHDGYAPTSRMCFVGMVALSERADERAARSIDTIRATGTKVVLFKDIEIDSRRANVSPIPEGIAFKNRLSARELSRARLPMSYGFGKADLYEGFSDADVCSLINAAHAADQRVAVLGFSDKYDRIYRSADIVVTCSSEEYTLKGSFETQVDVTHSSDGHAREDVCETVRQRADVVIPRPAEKKGGGISSLLGAIHRAKQSCVRLYGFFEYLLCIGAARVVLVMLPMLFGSASLDARHVLACSLIADMLVMVSYIGKETRPGEWLPHRTLCKRLNSPIRALAVPLIIFTSSALFSVVLPEIVSLFPSVPKYIDKNEYSLMSYVFFHIAVFVLLRFGIRRERISRIRNEIGKRIQAINVIYPVLTVLWLILCFNVPYLSETFGIEGFTSKGYALLSVIPVTSCFVLYFFFGSYGFDALKKKLKSVINCK